MKITNEDWKEIELTACKVARVLNLHRQMVYMWGNRNVSKPTIQHLKRLVYEFPEKKDQLLALFEKRLGVEVVKKILEPEKEKLEHLDGYKEKFYTVIFSHLRIFSGSDGYVIDSIKSTATDLGVSAHDVLEAIKRNLT